MANIFKFLGCFPTGHQGNFIQNRMFCRGLGWWRRRWECFSELGEGWGMSSLFTVLWRSSCNKVAGLQGHLISIRCLTHDLADFLCALPALFHYWQSSKAIVPALLWSLYMIRDRSKGLSRHPELPAACCLVLRQEPLKKVTIRSPQMHSARSSSCHVSFPFAKWGPTLTFPWIQGATMPTLLFAVSELHKPKTCGSLNKERGRRKAKKHAERGS